MVWYNGAANTNKQRNLKAKQAYKTGRVQQFKEPNNYCRELKRDDIRDKKR